MGTKKVTIKAVQDLVEFDWFTTILKSENVKSYLEIGSRWGGSLLLAARALPIGSRIVSVDLPWGDRASEPELKATIAQLKTEGYDAHLRLGDSTDPETICIVQALGPYDAIFIDANHTLPYVTADWENYSHMGRIIAFHDIGWVPRPAPSNKLPIEVPVLWSSLKKQYRHKEIKLHPRDNGIGVLWRF
jgi:predicted O-methyltransferase YrrM